MSDDMAHYMEATARLRARVRELGDVVHSLARHDPRPTTDDEWCYFCGEHLTAENGHNADACLWVQARALLPGTDGAEGGA